MQAGDGLEASWGMVHVALLILGARVGLLTQGTGAGHGRKSMGGRARFMAPRTVRWPKCGGRSGGGIVVVMQCRAGERWHSPFLGGLWEGASDTRVDIDDPCEMGGGGGEGGSGSEEVNG